MKKKSENSKQTSSLFDGVRRGGNSKKPSATFNGQSGGTALALLREYRAEGRSSSLNDKRIGQNDKHASEDSKILRRLQALHKRSLRKSKFNLEEASTGGHSPHDSLSLTVRGRALGQLSDASLSQNGTEFFARRREDRDAEEQLAMQHGHDITGLLDGDGSANKARTAKDVYREIAAKTKAARAQVAAERRTMSDELDQINASFADIAPTLGYVSSSADHYPDSTTAKIGRSAHGGAAGKRGGTREDEAAFDAKYDQMMAKLRQLNTTRHAATTRKLTEQEVATQNAARLAKMEADREHRMTTDTGDVGGVYDDDGDTSDDTSDEGDDDNAASDDADGDDDSAATSSSGDASDNEEEGSDQQSPVVAVEDDDEALCSDDDDVDSTRAVLRGGELQPGTAQHTPHADDDDDEGHSDDDTTCIVDNNNNGTEHHEDDDDLEEYTGGDTLPTWMTNDPDEADMPFVVNVPKHPISWHQLLHKYPRRSRWKLIHRMRVAAGPESDSVNSSTGSSVEGGVEGRIFRGLLQYITEELAWALRRTISVSVGVERIGQGHQYSDFELSLIFPDMRKVTTRRQLYNERGDEVLSGDAVQRCTANDQHSPDACCGGIDGDTESVMDHIREMLPRQGVAASAFIMPRLALALTRCYPADSKLLALDQILSSNYDPAADGTADDAAAMCGATAKRKLLKLQKHSVVAGGVEQSAVHDAEGRQRRSRALLQVAAALDAASRPAECGTTYEHYSCPTPYELALYRVVLSLYSATDKRHGLCGPTTALLEFWAAWLSDAQSTPFFPAPHSCAPTTAEPTATPRAAAGQQVVDPQRCSSAHPSDAVVVPTLDDVSVTDANFNVIPPVRAGTLSASTVTLALLRGSTGVGQGRYSPYLYSLAMSVLHRCVVDLGHAGGTAAAVCREIGTAAVDTIWAALQQLRACGCAASYVPAMHIVLPTAEYIIKLCTVQPLASEMMSAVQRLINLCRNVTAQSLMPLQLLAAPVKGITMLTPKFMDTSDPRAVDRLRLGDNAEHARKRQLLRDLKRGRRSAARKLKQDAMLVGAFRAEDKKKHRAKQHGNYKRVAAMFQQDHSEYKQMRTTGGTMDTSLGAYRATKKEVQARRTGDARQGKTPKPKKK